MKSKATAAARILLGLVFFVFGLNGFLQFIPQPPLAGAAAQFMGGLAASGYFFPVLKAVETLAGLSLLAGRFVPLTLTVLAPVVVNIVLFHVFLAPMGLPLALLVLLLEGFLAWSYRAAFRPVLAARDEVVQASGAPVVPVTAPAK
jgi:uncharacterized membrane protein YphA (DoxX/SURF4 family)